MKKHDTTGRRRRFSLTARAVTATVAVTVATLAGAAAPASALSGGTVDTNPAVVSVGYGRCTGVQISESIVLTAAHCAVPRAGFLTVKSDGWYDPTQSLFIDRFVRSSGGDVAIAHLEKPHPLASYPRVNLNYKPAVGQTGVIYGAGSPTGGQQRTAPITVVASGAYVAGGPTIQVNAPNAGPRNGDSGGPLIVDGAVVGVLYGGYDDEDGWYSQLSSIENAALIASEVPEAAVGYADGKQTAPYYEIKNVASGLALDVRESSTSVGAQITQQTFTGATSQQWTLIRDGQNVRIVNRNSGQVIGVPAGSHTPGTNTVQWTALGASDQAWSKVQQSDGTFTFTNGESGQTLVPTSTQTGAPVVQDDAHGTDDEKWVIVRVG